MAARAATARSREQAVHIVLQGRAQRLYNSPGRVVETVRTFQSPRRCAVACPLLTCVWSRGGSGRRVTATSNHPSKVYVILLTSGGFYTGEVTSSRVCVSALVGWSTAILSELQPSTSLSAPLDWHVGIKHAWNATRRGRHKDGGGVLSRVSQSMATSSAIGRLRDDGCRWL